MLWIYRAKAVVEKRLFPKRTQAWRRWKQHDAQSSKIIDHTLWRRFLAHHVVMGEDEIARVAYGHIPAADISLLDDYLAALAALPISRYGRDEQFAFWANLYNALTVRLILRSYPVSSVRRIGLVPLWLGGGPWNRKLATIEGVPLSLNDIEHRILRRNWRDPRIHYAVNCGSLGCPNLWAEPFEGCSLEEQLETAAARFVNHPRGAHFAQGLRVSSIYIWFRMDFGGSDEGVLAHLRRYAQPALIAMLDQDSRIAGHSYDWRLNDATTLRPARPRPRETSNVGSDAQRHPDR